MKTEVIMERELFNSKIRQQSKSQFFSATDLVNAGNYWRFSNKMAFFNLAQYFKQKSTKEFIESLEDKYSIKCINKSRGRNSSTWVHPLLFIDIALAIDPKLKIEVYEWLFDNLIKFRNDSGDSYKKMAGALQQNCRNKRKFESGISMTAQMIKSACNVEDWQKASEPQLKLRDKIHENISLLSDVLKDNNQAIRLGIEKTIKNGNGQT